MKLHFRTIVAAAVLATATGTVTAQVTPRSLRNFATGGLYSDEVDNFASVVDWHDVVFDNAFEYMDYNGTGNTVGLTSNYVSAGVATKFANWYTAAFYNFLDSKHDASVLLGKGSMGLRFGVNVGEANTLPTATQNNVVTPFFYWGNRTELNGNLFKPEAGVAVSINGTSNSAQPRYVVKPKFAASYSLDEARTLGFGYNGDVKLATEKVPVDNGKLGIDNTLNLKFTAKKSMADNF